MCVRNPVAGKLQTIVALFWVLLDELVGDILPKKYKASKEEILKDLTDALNESSETIYKNYDGDVLAVGLVGFRDVQMMFTGPLDIQRGAGLMLTVVNAVGKELKIITDEESEFIEKIVMKFKND